MGYRILGSSSPFSISWLPRANSSSTTHYHCHSILPKCTGSRGNGLNSLKQRARVIFFLFRTDTLSSILVTVTQTNEYINSAKMSKLYCTLQFITDVYSPNSCFCPPRESHKTVHGSSIPTTVHNLNIHHQQTQKYSHNGILYSTEKTVSWNYR